jgi:hypothetical protein
MIMRLDPRRLTAEKESILGRIGVNIDASNGAALHRLKNVDFTLELYAVSLASDTAVDSLLGAIEPGNFYDALKATSVPSPPAAGASSLGEKLLGDRETSGDILLIHKSTGVVERLHRTVLRARRVETLKAVESESVPG